MKLLEKIDNLHQYISFNLFALDGYVVLYFILFYYLKDIGTAGTIFAFMLVAFTGIPLTLAFLFFLVERLNDIRIKNSFFTQNKILKIIRYIGAIIVIIFLVFFSVVFSIVCFMPSKIEAIFS